MGLQVVVVGAGIVGAAISHSAAKIGAKVRVLDVVSHPGTGGATRTTWAWINAGKKHPQHYRDLNLAGLRRWKAEWPGLVSECGSLLLDEEDGPSIDDPAYPGRRLSPEEVLRLEPHIAPEAAARGAVLYAQEAWVDPQEACAAMLKSARAAGADVMLGPGQRVERLLVEELGGGGAAGGQGGASPAAAAAAGCRVTGVQTADGQTHAADVVVLAAGAAVGPLAAQAGVAVPLLHKPAVVAVTAPVGAQGGQARRLLSRLLASSRVFAWQRPDGTFMLGDTRVHEDASAAWGESLLQRAAELLPELRAAGARVESVEAAYRPWPQDGHPIIGPAPSCRGLYIATMHSGVTLAPEVGRLVATELAHWDTAAGAAAAKAGGGGGAEELAAAQAVLEPYRLDRDFEEGAKRNAYGWK
ncbi:hypothetical protein GPECTOR_30g156 [Gonium pectorale]|uniref:FAD dependent oxidoreductase domain-containing protein n=1 Tax=Gonium pectorale TaxID=33097 RepID=A0A150GDY1_GONPE|nr:hypothetical protein GPECTOR_30g156 [Gonium pectorale]|eukprot:KXZ48061.1 hypothetical protein GPECTOR_30g156 [Gonium pectorale]